jgi:hypothetical protein
MEIISVIVSAFFKAFGLMGGLLMKMVDNISHDIRMPLVHEGVPPELALALVSLIPLLTLIAAWRILNGKIRTAICAFFAAAFVRIVVPGVMAYLHSVPVG